jgi:6-pyruvoyl-tetrahydropterin synthase
VCRQANLRQEPQKHHSLFQQSEVKTCRVFATDLRSVSIRSLHGHGYAVSFVENTDDGSSGMVFCFMKNKSRATAVLQRFINDCKKLGIKIASRIQSDRGIEYFEQEGIGRIYDKEPILHLISI